MITTINLAATFTADEAVAYTTQYFKRAEGRSICVELAGFNQVIQSLLNENSIFFTSNGINICLIRPSDVKTTKGSDGVDDIMAALKAYNDNDHANVNCNYTYTYRYR